MLIIALVLAVVSLAALVTAVVTSNELIAWVCIGLSALGVVLLIVDAIRDRHHRAAAPAVVPADRTEVIVPVQTGPVETTEVIETAGVIEPVGSEAGVIAGDEYPEMPDAAEEAADYPDLEELELLEDHPDEVVYDEPDYDTPSDDEPVYPVPAEEAAIHTVSDTEVDDEFSASESYAETAEQPYTADSTIVIYAAEPYTGESSAVTESYVVINPDESEALADVDDSYTVTYADEIDDDDESGNSGERRESDSER